ncbi:hypothetical protein [Paenibacillus sp. FSL K6-2524]|uniref:hypothetical protein n=1 Tax=Paenibacillus sp. FSL K6-2524 TaxID=2954516 RepID=UPI0030FAF43F
MFAVIQKLKNKKPNPYGEYKELLVDSFTISFNGITETKYTYRYGGGRFERPTLDAYKIMIHHSYRENGEVKKKQWVICTMGYYYLLDSWPGDCIRQDVLNKKLQEMEITEEQLWEMVYEKLDPIIAQVKSEFESSEEYRVHAQHRQVIDQYLSVKREFEKLYGDETYDYCYDVFGNLRNTDYLEKLLDKRERENAYQRSSYQSRESSNYSSGGFNYEDFSSYFGVKQSTYTEDEKVMLKKVYRSLSKAFHPDITKDDGEIMKLINKLKEEWGI